MVDAWICGLGAERFIEVLSLARRTSSTMAPAERRAIGEARGVPSFACTPDLFPAMMAAAVGKSDLGEWASGIVATGHERSTAWRGARGTSMRDSRRSCSSVDEW